MWRFFKIHFWPIKTVTYSLRQTKYFINVLEPIFLVARATVNCEIGREERALECLLRNTLRARSDVCRTASNYLTSTVSVFQGTARTRHARVTGSAQRASACARRAGKAQTAAKQTTTRCSAFPTAPATEPLTWKRRHVSVNPCGQAMTAPEVRGENIS